MKNFWAQKAYNIPIDWRVCGENLYAKHGIHYSKENGNELDSFFQMFSVWNERNIHISRAIMIDGYEGGNNLIPFTPNNYHPGNDDYMGQSAFILF